MNTDKFNGIGTFYKLLNSEVSCNELQITFYPQQYLYGYVTTKNFLISKH